jgi:hypothetical protein
MIYIAKFDLHFVDGEISELSGNLLAVLVSLIASSAIVLISNQQTKKNH